MLTFALTEAQVAGAVRIGVFFVDGCVLAIYLLTMWRLARRIKTDALIPGRLCIAGAIVLALIQSLTIEIADWGDSLTLNELTQYVVGILLIIGWAYLVDVWLIEPPPWPQERLRHERRRRTDKRARRRSRPAS